MGLGIGIKTMVRRNRVRGEGVPLLDQPFASGATAAYSLRLLRAKHSGGLVRVRADDAGTDKGEADVLPLLQPDGSKIIELNSPIENLNSKAQNRLGAPEGGGDKVLADLVDSGGSNFDGFTSNWYEQSPNQHDASQEFASRQPKIVSSASVVKENSKPAMQFTRNNSTHLELNEFSYDHSNFQIFAVSKLELDEFCALISNDTLQSNSEISFIARSIRDAGLEFIVDDNFGKDIFSASQFLNSQLLHNYLFDGSKSGKDELNIRLNGSQSVGGYNNGSTDVNTTTVINDKIRIGQREKNQDSYEGKMQEIIFYDKNKAANEAKIENNINNYFSIY